MPILTTTFSQFSLKTPAKWRVLLFGLAMCFASLAMTVSAQLPTPTQPLPSAELALRLKKLESELRCLVCQNQTLAESPAGLAGDLRREVRLLIDQGKTDDEIKTYLQARYGDFVLYKPPVDRKTWVLWFGPFALLGIGACAAWLIARRRREVMPISMPTSDAAKRARNLLNDDVDSEGKK
jgi:cytochrome c-type biogenesis protein CcmH